MRLSPLIFCTMIITNASTLTAEAPVGEWTVEDRSINVRIENCGSALWGIVSGELDPAISPRSPGQDSANPDPALRGRPTLGMPILLDMKENESTSWGEKTTRWEGQIYNFRKGKTYEANIRLLRPAVIKLE